MAQARDELFLKLALRQGLFSQPEAVQFLQRYRSEGAPGEGIGHWLVTEGVLAEEQAGVIIEAIANRAQGHVSDTRRRVPRAQAGARGSGRAAKAPADHGHHAHHRHEHGPPRGVKASPAQQVIYIGSGILAVALMVIAAIRIQRDDPVLPAPIAAPKPPKAATSEELAERISAGEDAAKDPTPETMQWSPEEIANMKIRLGEAIALARGHMGDGRPGRGLETLRKRAEELGEILPPEIRTQLDEEAAELQKLIDETYADVLAQLKAAKGKGDATAAEKALFAIEEACGPAYLEKAKKAVE
jgi:hypothetical protein